MEEKIQKLFDVQKLLDENARLKSNFDKLKKDFFIVFKRYTHEVKCRLANMKEDEKDINTLKDFQETKKIMLEYL